METLEKIFPPYYEALELIELGITEEITCLAFRKKKDGELCVNVPEYLENKLTKEFSWRCIDYVEVPTYGQVFDYFREKYKIFPYTYTGNGNLFHYCMFIKDRDNQYHSNDLYLSNEEAELECVKKLIEIAKEKLVVSK